MSERAERAMLVGLELGPQRRSQVATAARQMAVESGLWLRGTQPAPQAMDPDESLSELRELVTSAGGEVTGSVLQRRAEPDPATLIGSGKVTEIAAMASMAEADVIVFDHELSPSQLRNLERALPCRVIDRTQLILDIFARHARTREGQLQVELAQLEYMLPRLTGRGHSMSQTGGGIGTRGPGETQLETDRRRIQRRLIDLTRQIEGVRRVRAQQRQRRESAPVPTVALVGYTNAGKSTLFNALTHAGVLESGRMFATLDPKLRSLVLPSRRKILLSDTVGFIRNLPHTLVTSFRATLEEVTNAELLLHIRDAASPYGEEQRTQVEQVLDELGVLQKPRIEVLNKADLLTPSERIEAFAANTVTISARTGEGLDALLAAIDAELVSDPIQEASLLVPQSEGSILAQLESDSVIQHREFIKDKVRLQVAAPASLLGRLRRFRDANTAGQSSPKR